MWVVMEAVMGVVAHPNRKALSVVNPVLLKKVANRRALTDLMGPVVNQKVARHIALTDLMALVGPVANPVLKKVANHIVLTDLMDIITMIGGGIVKTIPMRDILFVVVLRMLCFLLGLRTIIKEQRITTDLEGSQAFTSELPLHLAFLGELLHYPLPLPPFLEMLDVFQVCSLLCI
jgi:hypothetical protein